MKSILSFIVIIVMMLSTFFGSFSEPAADLAVQGSEEEVVLHSLEEGLLRTVFETETAWIASLQLENGAIPMTDTKNGEVSVNPYFADIAALALLDNAEKYAENVKAYMDWHFSHLNTSENDYNRVNGTIYDYTVTLEDGKIIKEEVTVKDGKKSYDSTDSYAATFLMVLDKYYEKTNDSEYIASKSADIERVVDALFATLDMGLTYAKPDYKVKYLMDNCEVYDGLKAALKLYENIICKKDSSYNMTSMKIKYAVEWVEQTIESKLWNAEDGHYEAGIFEDSSVAVDFKWDEFYPSATSQLFTIIHGVIDADTVRANNLYNSFCENYNWETINIPSEFCWGANVYAAAIMGDTDRVVDYMTSYTVKFMLTHDYPLYNADAARVAMAAYTLLEKAA